MQKLLSVTFVLWLSFNCHLVEAATSSALSTTSNVSSTTSVTQQNETLIEKYKVMVENQDKRLSDIWGAINILGFIAALLGVLTTAIVVFFSLRSASTAVAEAKIEAGKTIEDWLKSNAEQLLLEETKKVIAPQLEHALKEIREAATPILVALDAELQKTVKLNEDLEAKLGTSKAAEADERSHADQAASQQDSLAQPQSSPSATPASARTVGHPSRSALRQAQSLVREDRYAEAIAIIDSITEQLCDSADEQDQVMYVEACLERISITDKLGDQLKAHSEYLKLSSELASTTSPAIAKVLLRTLYAQALIEEKIGHLEVAVATCDKLISVVDQFNFTSKPELLRLIRTLNLKGRCLYSLKQYQLLIESYEDYQRRFSGSTPIELANTFLTVNLNLRYVRSLIQLGQLSDAKEFLKKTIAKYDEPSERVRHGEIWRLKLLLSSIYEDERNYQEALAVSANIVQEYQKDTTAGPVTIVMQALLRKAAILSELGLSKEEIHVYDEIVEMGSHQKDDDGTLLFPAYVVTAMVNKAITLSKIGNSSDALNVVNAVLSEFNASIDENVIEQTTKAAKLKAVLER